MHQEFLFWSDGFFRHGIGRSSKPQDPRHWLQVSVAIAGLFECYNPLAIYLCIHLSSPFLCGLSFARLVCSIGKLRASRIICSRCSSLVMYSTSFSSSISSSSRSPCWSCSAASSCPVCCCCCLLSCCCSSCLTRCCCLWCCCCCCYCTLSAWNCGCSCCCNLNASRSWFCKSSSAFLSSQACWARCCSKVCRACSSRSKMRCSCAIHCVAARLVALAFLPRQLAQVLRRWKARCTGDLSQGDRHRFVVWYAVEEEPCT